MRVRELSDDDIGRYVWVRISQSGIWRRVCFEGFTNEVQPTAEWVLVKVPPTTAGALMLRETDSDVTFTAVLVRADSEAMPVDVEWAVSADGEIIELGEHAS